MNLGRVMERVVTHILLWVAVGIGVVFGVWGILGGIYTGTGV
jgi:hypothetical protein